MSFLLNAINLPFIGEVDLQGSVLLVFFLCLLCVIGFEFVNGFHDTANAVATVIYTKALKPMVAVPWSGFCNFMGVFTGGVAVAMGILKLVPLNDLMALPVQVGACMVLSVLLASIIWNLGTWYLGIPCSSSHTLIGAMIGAGLGFTYFYKGAGVNWGKAGEIGLSLILSPLLGFGVAVLLMLFLRHVIKSQSLFHIPQGENDRPKPLIRGLLILTCTTVSYFHGSNDGQKGVGLLMLILIAFLPAKFALDSSVSADKIAAALSPTQQVIQRAIAANPDVKPTLDSLSNTITETSAKVYDIAGTIKSGSVDHKAVYAYRKQIQAAAKALTGLAASGKIQMPEADRAIVKKASGELGKLTDYAPLWVIATISISLGIGTMIGWKRIVTTIGEKIGKEHLNYAQGATAEITAASMIGLATASGLPVSTTHVLSSGIAGAMVASGGTKNLNSGTLRNIALAWVLTLPVSIILALGLFFIFHLFV
jgi:PiT family inorganic phosphate transporter